MVAGRFRIVSLLGRGGMGEVYRAEDLRLRETVALKFLPGELAQDVEARSRLEQEVRLARRVTHPHVCRVFDVVDVDAGVALCMEYVDGEYLGSLLRRVGHLPAQRALQVARQIVLGVGAIHRQGLLHRDLKPANVMIDGRGAARVMDFGLAAEGPDGLFCGTPAYMAPEQLAGTPASVQSDLYSLALVLHELFTGVPAFPSRQTLAELRHDRTELAPRPLDAATLGLPDRFVEVLASCLSRHPAERPRSAAELLAALPVGDAIAEALASGETPSPDAVAGGGPDGHLSPRAASLLLLVAALGLVVFFGLVDRVSVIGQIAPQLSTDVLADRARTLLTLLRGEPPRQRGWRGFSMVAQVGGLSITPPIWERWHDADRAPFAFLYAEPMQPTDPTIMDDHLSVGLRGITGEAGVVLSLRGNLQRLAITPPLPPRTGGDPVGWAELFAAAGLPPPESLEELPPTGFMPPMFADERRVWRVRNASGDELLAYAAAVGGAPIYFSLRAATAPAPGADLAEPHPSITTASDFDFMEVVRSGTLLLLALGGWLAWRNVRAGRADRRGAFRLGALVLLVGGALQCSLTLLSTPAARDQLSFVVFDMLKWTLLTSVLIALLYLALEPEIRRRRPRAAVAWARLLRGDVWNPLVGRELLIGNAFGGALAGVWAIEQWAVHRLGTPWPLWEPVFAQSMLESPLNVLAAFSGALTVMLVVAFLPLLLWAWLLPLLRSSGVAEAVAVLLTMGLAVAFTAGGLTASGSLLGALIAMLSLRVGIVASLALCTFWPILISGAYTLDSGRFYFANTVVALAIYVCIAVLAWRAAVRRVPQGAASAAS